MAIEIRQTTVTPTEGADVVQLHISDAKLGDESASFVLTLLAKGGPFENPMLVHLQMEAMDHAVTVLGNMVTYAQEELKRQGYPPLARPASGKV